ncbi:3'-5' exonuclease [Heliophilum fasciatum]|uniref:DNA polymerase-3 subunit epsilon n=1 Tax=Heliophilum fasciatum TaxID=35700 RepID=A0A4R2RVG0_9FIRM|nr:exonuclease domain-containing protein [Heliophilum fasciatum]MCW2278298.1 DNA polymerase-3 subunit epsilon [Heliophilum fasciatum]TCP63921.1 DNA polymerase-3 subunit epsilon [Heliophilum fasciatum]
MVSRIFHHVRYWLNKNTEIDDQSLERLRMATHSQKNRRLPLLRRPINDLRFVVFDTETTGFSPQKDALIAIGAVAVTNNEINSGHVFDALINPQRPIPPVVQELTGITDSDVEGASTVYPVLAEFLAFIEGSVLVAHRASFDVAFVNQSLKSIHMAMPNPVIDTLSLSKAIHPHLTDHSLDGLIETYNLPAYPRHTALGDAMMTAHLFTILLHKLRERRTILTLGDLAHIVHQGHL